jgi:uncharacterized protein YdeI (BOF family)
MTIKKKISDIWFITFILGLMLTLSGCGRKEAEKYGQQISDQTPTKTSAILTKPLDYDDKTVTIEGTIIRECPTGCWFDIKEQEGIIHVDINPSGFAIPQKIGKTVMVEGKVSVRDNQPIIIGSGVQIK